MFYYRSSETLRKNYHYLYSNKLFNYLYNPILHTQDKGIVDKHNILLNRDNNQLGYYLAGLIEADGSIIIPKENSKNSPTISISFNILDKPLAICIKDRLGFGSIENIENNNAVKFIIRGKNNILIVVSLINGKFRTPKIEKLHNLIDYINNM